MMDHPIDWLSAYVDDELLADERRQVEAHLDHCESCTAEVRQMMQLKAELAGFYEVIEPPLYFDEQVMQAIDTKSESWLRSWLVAPMAGVACLLTLWVLMGNILLKLLSILIKFISAAFYVFSSIVTTSPAVLGTVLMIAFMLIVVSGISLRRLLRSTIQ